jgi:hypothetical protein
MTEHNEVKRLQDLADAVARLPQSIEPPIDQWPAIQRCIDEARVVVLPGAASARPGRFARIRLGMRGPSLRFVAAAAVLIVIVGGAYLAGRNAEPRMVTPLADVPSIRPAAPATVPSVPSFPPKSGSKPAAQLHAVSTAANFDRDRVLGAFDAYEDAARELSWSIATRRSRLDPATLAVLDTCLKQIDKAIAEARAALGRNPRNDIIGDLLRSSYEQKLRLLKRTAEGPLRTL